MKKLSLLAIFFSLVLVEVTQAAPVPLLKIESPTDGQIIESYVVDLKFSLKNFVLKDYRSTLRNNPNEGHLLIWLDEEERRVSNTVKYYKASPYSLADVSPGKHTLVVELANNDSTSFDPPISQTIKFETKAPIGSEAAPVETGDQPLVAETKTGEVPELSQGQSWPGFMSYFIAAVILITLGILGVVYLKKSSPPPLTPLS